MDNRWYVVSVIINSNGSETRNMQPYDSEDTAIRKWHEAFNTIGGGPKLISATILDRFMNQDPRHTEVWQEQEPEPEPNEGE